MVKRRKRGFPWKYHGAGLIECLKHHPGVVVHAGTCRECMEGVGKSKNAMYPSPGCVPADDPYDPTVTNKPIPVSWEIKREVFGEPDAGEPGSAKALAAHYGIPTRGMNPKAPQKKEHKVTRRHWPESLEEVLAEPVVRSCPATCPFSELCPSHIQEGINSLFLEGRYAGPQECIWYEKMSAKVLAELGGTVPTSPAELREQLKRVRLERATP